MKRLVFGWLLAAALGGCATLDIEHAGATVPEGLFADQAFEPRELPVNADQVFAISPAMKHYVDVEMAPFLRLQGRQRGLVFALHSRAQLRLDYDTEITRSAAEAFDARSGNCLSLVVMTAAFAKYLDLPIQYQALLGQESWSRDANLVIVNGHVNISIGKRLIDRLAGVETDSAYRLDFGTIGVGRGAWLRQVSERTIVAMFMNNRAAEALVHDDTSLAYAYAREAVRQDPGYAGGFNTLGVIYTRRGLADGAERAFRQALAIEPDQSAALTNLAQMYESQQREAQALPLRQALARIEREPPFQQFDLGRAAFARGEYALARDHLLRALRRDPDYHEFHYWLALALAGLGDARGAKEHLALAKDNSTTKRDHELYAGKLDRLKAATATRMQ